VRRVLLLALTASSIGCHRDAANGQAMFTTVASTREIMDGIVIPYSQAIFDAVAYENAQLARAPRNDDEWHRLKMEALAVAEAGNLLIMPSRARDDTGWPALAHDMTIKAADVAKAADRKDVDGVLQTGGELYETCTACHAKYVTQ
jgi:cytochrome c556